MQLKAVRNSLLVVRYGDLSIGENQVGLLAGCIVKQVRDDWSGAIGFVQKLKALA